MNEIEKIGDDVVHGVDTVAKDIGKVLGIVEKTAKVADAFIKDEATLKPAITQTLEAAADIMGEIAKVVAEKGISWTDDAALVSQVETFFKTTVEGILVPAVEKAYEDISAAAGASPAPPAATV